FKEELTLQFQGRINLQGLFAVANFNWDQDRGAGSFTWQAADKAKEGSEGAMEWAKEKTIKGYEATKVKARKGLEAAKEATGKKWRLLGTFDKFGYKELCSYKCCRERMLNVSASEEAKSNEVSYEEVDLEE
ncbi:hypothetical protein Tco_0600759, partial [Tanacetum coccineum]